MKVAVIGAGVAGLVSIRFLSEAFPDAVIDAFEVTDNIGGTWIYTDETEKDEFDLSVMTSMYKNLRANLPKVTMELSDFPIPEYYRDFMRQEDYLKYLKDYADHFNLAKYIKFRHYVTNVKKITNGWEVEYRDLRANRIVVGQYDYVYVCSGHYHHSFTPQIKGSDIFKGRQLHSHSYRDSEDFKDRTVLFIGCGPSAMDISIAVSKHSKKVYLSHHMPKIIPRVTHLIHKPDVREFTEHGVIFQDDSFEEIDDIMFCTGYDFYFPFLDESCGMTVKRTHVRHLYRHVVNVEHPSMLCIGIPVHCCAIVLRDMQARYAVSLIKGNFTLPSKETMLDILTKKDEERIEAGRGEKFVHDLILEEDEYYRDMAEESGVKRVPTVCCKIRQHVIKSVFYTLRNYKYTVVDDQNFFTTEYQTNETETTS